MASLIDQSGTKVFTGTIENGGSQPVGCLLESQIDLHDNGQHDLNWQDLYNNSSDFDHLLAIPAGLGLTFSFDGSDNTITTTEAGVWAFTLGFFVSNDVTWAGNVRLDANLFTSAHLPAAATVSIAETVQLPAGATIVPLAVTSTPATTDPYFCDCYLAIVRLG